MGRPVLPLNQLNTLEDTFLQLNRLQAASILPGIIEQERKMTSVLSLFPRGVNPTQTDVAITYHNQKVLVW